MSPDELSELLFSVMVSPVPQKHDETKMKQPVGTKVAKSIRVAGVNTRDYLSALVTERLSDSPEKVKWISDLHLFHGRIIDYCSRPFASLDEMNRRILSNWRASVASDDLVLVLGDVTLGQVPSTNALLDGLPGEKVLIVGNHDVGKDGKILDLHFSGIADCLSLNYCGTNLLVSHCPIPANRVPLGCVSVHGHIHGYSPDERGFNASVERMEYSPRSTLDFLDAPSLLWKSCSPRSKNENFGRRHAGR